jgi:hypothetical protein
MQHRGQAMSQLTVVSSSRTMGYLTPAQAAHDLCNLLATVALHLETLQRLSGPSGAKASRAAHVLLPRCGRCRRRWNRGSAAAAPWRFEGPMRSPAEAARFELDVAFVRWKSRVWRASSGKPEEVAFTAP